MLILRVHIFNEGELAFRLERKKIDTQRNQRYREQKLHYLNYDSLYRTIFSPFERAE